MKVYTTISTEVGYDASVDDWNRLRGMVFSAPVRSSH
jgi:hypothetical protein